MSKTNKIMQSFEERYPNLQGKTEGYVKTLKELVTKYPDYPDPEPIECLNLIMRKEFAEEIVAGIKKIEFRSVSDFYMSRLIDKKSDEFLRNLPKEDRNIYDCASFMLRDVKKIHFHNYNNSWSLDVGCNGVELITLDDAALDWLHAFGHYEYDELCKAERGTPYKLKPMFFCLIVGEILERNNI